MMLTEIARQADFGKGTTHRVLAALVEVGFVHQDAENRRYRLGARLALLARHADAQELAFRVQPLLDRLAEETGDTAFCTIREGLFSTCIARATGAFPIRTLTLDVGHRRPLGIGAGSLALLAALPDGLVEEAIAKNARALARYPVATPEFLRARVTEARRQGFARNPGDIIPGMGALAMTVLGPAGQPVAALSLAAIRERIEAPREAMLVEKLAEAARDLTAALR
jgi:DNA-binding IclR family transcriptional regulator